MDSSVILDATTTLINFPTVLWTTLSATFGTVPSIIVMGLASVGLYFIGRGILRWFGKQIRRFLTGKEQEVCQVPQPQV